IGRALAAALAERGGRVVLTGRRTDVLEPLAERLGGPAIKADLAERGAAERLLDAAGRVDVLVAKAAVPPGGAPRRLHDQRDRPCAGRQPARTDRDGEARGRADGRTWPRA